MRQIIEVADKSVSTEDFIHDDKEPLEKGILDVAKLESVLAALVEHKVVSIRTENEKSCGSNHSSPIALLASRIHRRFQSNSTVSSDKEKGGKCKSSGEIRCQDEQRVIEEERSETQAILEEDGRETLKDEGYEKSRHGSRGDHSKRRRRDRSERGGEERDRNRDRERDRSSDRMSDRCWIEREPCILQTSSEMLRHSDMLEECSVLSLGGEECVVVLERERTRTRTRRKRRKRKHHHHRTIIVESIDEKVKVLDPDELPRKARWTIMVTACLLLFLCLMLVGVTLRMAPLIDDMVRQENERMIESFNVPSNMSRMMMEHRKHLESPT